MNNKRVISVDMAKGIAMVMVILVHYEQSFNICKWLKYFRMGCPIFFVASGFGVMCLINRRFNGELSSKNVWEFYKSRVKAIVPSWWLAFFIVFSVNSVLIALFGRTLSFGTNRGVLSVVCNLLLLHGFFPFCNNSVMPGGWYIGATVILYALTPVILILLRNIKNWKMLYGMSIMVSIIAWRVLRIFLGGGGENFDYYVFVMHFPEYLLGFILYHCTMEREENRLFFKYCVPIGIAILICAYWTFYMSWSINLVLSSWLTAVGTFVILYRAIFEETTRGRMISRYGNILCFISKNSLGIYLLQGFWVWTFISVLKKAVSLIGININTWIWFVILFPFVVVLCCLSGYLFNIAVKKIMGRVRKSEV